MSIEYKCYSYHNELMVKNNQSAQGFEEKRTGTFYYNYMDDRRCAPGRTAGRPWQS